VEDGRGRWRMRMVIVEEEVIVDTEESVGTKGE
jgi:hypothetical protein